MATLGTMTRDIHRRSNRHGVSVYIDSRDLTAVLSDFSHIQTECESRLTTALLAGANTVLNSAKTKVHVKTGTLKRSLHAEVEDAGSVIVGTDVSYARFVEKGTCRSKAYPYLLPALTENVKRIEGSVNRAMRKLAG